MEKSSINEPVGWLITYWSPDCGEQYEFYMDYQMAFRDKTEYMPLYTSPPTQISLSDEQHSIFYNAFCLAAEDEYFAARPQLDSATNRRIFFAGYKKAWVEKYKATGEQA